MCLGGSRQDRITLPDLLHIQMILFNHSDHLIFFSSPCKQTELLSVAQIAISS